MAWQLEGERSILDPKGSQTLHLEPHLGALPVPGCWLEPVRGGRCLLGFRVKVSMDFGGIYKSLQRACASNQTPSLKPTAPNGPNSKPQTPRPPLGPQRAQFCLTISACDVMSPLTEHPPKKPTIPTLQARNRDTLRIVWGYSRLSGYSGVGFSREFLGLGIPRTVWKYTGRRDEFSFKKTSNPTRRMVKEGGPDHSKARMAPKLPTLHP